MTETRATAHLPSLDIEIHHRQEPDAETLTVSLRAVPGLDAVGAWLDPMRLWGEWLRLNPFLRGNPWLPASPEPRRLPRS
jgi:hypothetical protein